MTYALPLSERRRYAEAKRRRYWSNPAERLKRINEARERRGMPTVASLDDVETRGAAF